MSETESSKLQLAEFREAFNEFDKVCHPHYRSIVFFNCPSFRGLNFDHKNDGASKSFDKILVESWEAIDYLEAGLIEKRRQFC